MESDAIVETRDPEEHLRELIQSARGGSLPPEAHATLERAVMGFWREQLQLGELPPSELSTALRAHDEAGPMLDALEKWLHAPSPQPADLASLLRPIEEKLAQKTE